MKESPLNKENDIEKLKRQFSETVTGTSDEYDTLTDDQARCIKEAIDSTISDVKEGKI